MDEEVRTMLAKARFDVMQQTFALCLLIATPASADIKDDLLQRIEGAGQFAYADERRNVEINGCQMTTFRWRDIPDHGWVLWTSFQFDMVDAQLNEDRRFPGRKYAYTTLEAGPPEIGFGLYGFTMREGTLTRHEKPWLRDAQSDTTPSPRGDGTTHYYEFKTEMVVSMNGPGVAEKAIAFTTSYDQYVAEYCTFSS
jgi:hypothetical protein